MIKIYDTIVVGAGPGGMNTALYLARSGKSVALIERGSYGGALLDTTYIENYLGYSKISGPELAKEMKSHISEQKGIEYLYGNVKSVVKEDGVFEVKTRKDSFKSKTVVIATGAKYKDMGLPGEKELFGAGISNCATCDGAFFKDKSVAVIGGGDSAMTSAIYLADICESVVVVHRRDEFRAEDILVKQAWDKGNVEFLYNADTTRFIGNNALEVIEFTHNDTGQKNGLEVSGAFINVGMVPNIEPFRDLKVITDDGFVMTDSDMQTSVDGVYAIGDIRSDSIRQVVNAVADGAVASDSINKYLNKLK